jgi:hypothetical protein
MCDKPSAFVFYFSTVKLGGPNVTTGRLLFFFTQTLGDLNFVTGGGFRFEFFSQNLGGPIRGPKFCHNKKTVVITGNNVFG